ncbi:MAG: choice-of-anchor D domain-containing protein, partial [Candidatus Eisenbacteria bacterium]|nr:choice-of-anchor D domain-containing protein [Candidatus Latescibacterota bacterium]MBD3302940.1 choice-of-anchor D domain-containing protein [Candidatus Eisenbacteria bacterium]
EGTVSSPCPEFSIVSGEGGFVLAEDESLTVTVRFIPEQPGDFSCGIETGAALCGTVPCVGTGTEPPPECAVSPLALDFGEIGVGEAAARSFWIRNAGGGALSGAVTADCEAFAILSGGGAYALPAGDSVRVEVEFAPDSSGTFACAIETGTEACPDVACTGSATDDPPVCALEPASLEFGEILVGESIERTFTVRNAGGGVLAGEIAEECDAFEIPEGAGPFSLAAGESLRVTVRFAPPDGGPASCAVETGIPPCPSVSCTGTGIGPACVVEPETLDFGEVLVGGIAEETFTITNTGGGILSGTVSETCPDFRIIEGGGGFALAAEEVLTVTLRFAPLAGGDAECTVTTGTDDCADLPCTGIGIDASCEVSPESIDFGSVLIGESADASFTIENAGGGTLSGAVTIDCPDYAIVSGGGSYQLGPGQARDVTIRFAPSDLGQSECVVETGDGRCADVPCTGEGIGPICDVAPSEIDFGPVDAGATRDTTFTIRNVGAGILNGEVTEACDAYEILSGGGPFALAAGDSQIVAVRFAPAEGGVFPCSIETGAERCVDVACTGEGIQPICEVIPEAIDFGSVLVGEAVDSTFTIANRGNGILSGAVSESCEAYEVVSGGGSFALGADEERVVTVRFAPLEDGPAPCTIETGTERCVDVSCTGEGIGPHCAVEPTVLAFGEVGVGAARDTTFTIRNEGGGILEGEVGEDCPDYEVVSGGGPFGIGAGDSVVVTVRFAPQEVGESACTIETGTALCPDVSCTGKGCPDCPESPLVLDAVADVMIRSEHPDSNFCASPVDLFGRTGADSSGLALTLLRFDLSAIPPEAILLDVHVEVTADSCAENPPGEQIAFALRRPDESFEECTVTWGNAPTLSSLPQCRDTFSCEPGVKAYGCEALSNLVRSWIDAPQENHGLGFAPDGSAPGALVIRSRRHSEGPPPRLVVEFECPCP